MFIYSMSIYAVYIYIYIYIPLHRWRVPAFERCAPLVQSPRYPYTGGASRPSNGVLLWCSLRDTLTPGRVPAFERCVPLVRSPRYPYTGGASRPSNGVLLWCSLRDTLTPVARPGLRTVCSSGAVSAILLHRWRVPAFERCAPLVQSPRYPYTGGASRVPAGVTW